MRASRTQCFAAVTAILAAAIFECIIASRSHAACNIIPGTVSSFSSTLGVTDRPYARPGDRLEIHLDPVCDAASPGFGATPAGDVVTIVYTPPAGGPRNVVLVASDCAAVEPARASCEALPEVATATCIPATDPGALELVTNGGHESLRFRVPDTDALFPPAGDDRTFTGPASIAVSAVGQPVPCGLASGTCAGQSNVIACIDKLFVTDGGCGVVPDATFPHFTMLPKPNVYREVCTSPNPPCTGLTDELRFTVDSAGNVLIPMDWRGVLVNHNAVPVARLMRTSSTVEAFEGGGAPMVVPGPSFLASFSPEGRKIAPVFDPQSDPTSASSVTLFGSADAPETVLRIARRSSAFLRCAGGINTGLPCNDAVDCPSGTCGQATCVGGANAGLSCASDVACPGGECGPGLFDFSTRLLDATGPVVLGIGACIGGTNEAATCTNDGDCPGGQCGSFQAEALDPVPLDGLAQSTDD